jgi:glycosyltransferase involved in cell wall biosynthesis
VRVASASPVGTSPEGSTSRPLLTVVVPVYNGGEEIVENVDVIRRALTAGLPGESVEMIVVSDGSIDDTAERLLESRADRGIRVIHYDRNLGKGYAVKAGALASRGDWVALIDADLDLDPASIPAYLEVARREGLDLAIGSKRHPESTVHYPRSRRVASWCYQQLNGLLFRLDVRDTQVGLKVFSRRVADDVLPLLLVKRFAFDLELLAVASSLGYNRIRELPVRLDYRFTGSGVGSLAVLAALWDTAAIFYRLRILRTYERKRYLLSGAGAAARDGPPLVSLVGSPEALAALDYPRLELLPDGSAAAVGAAEGELVAILGPGGSPAGNWVTAAVPFFGDVRVSAVVVPTVASLRGPLRTRLASAVLESRLGGGSRRSLYLPGNVRLVEDHPAESLVVRKADYLAALAEGVDDERLVSWLTERRKRTIYTPDTSVSAAPAPLLRPHLAATFRHARARGAAARRSRGASLSGATALSLGPAVAAVVGATFVLVGGGLRDAGLALLIAYGVALAVSGIHTGARFRSLAVGVLQPPAVVASQATYVCGFVRGLMELPRTGRGEARASAF